MRATKVNAGLAESNGRLLLGIWRASLHVTCGLTACTPGSAPGPTLGNEYRKTLPLPFTPTRRRSYRERRLGDITSPDVCVCCTLIINTSTLSLTCRSLDDDAELTGRLTALAASGLQKLSYGPITIAIRARFEHDSSTIQLQHATTRYEVFRALVYEIVYENQW